MAIETFIWCPRIEAEADVKHRIRKAEFGDSYTQVSGDGLNSRTQEWRLSFVGKESYIQAIREFIDDHEGTKAFLWKPPLYPISLWRCEEYKPRALGAGNFSLEATFIQAFKP